MIYVGEIIIFQNNALCINLGALTDVPDPFCFIPLWMDMHVFELVNQECQSLQLCDTAMC